MENIIPKNWNKEISYSYLALILSCLWISAVIAYDNFTFPEIQNEFIHTNLFLLKEKLYNLGWYYPITDLSDWLGAYMPGIFFTAFVALAFWMGVKSFKTVSAESGRMFKIVPTTISGALLVWIAVGIINSPL
jgi:hypothetical protein